jgi:hypothetical protein
MAFSWMKMCDGFIARAVPICWGLKHKENNTVWVIFYPNKEKFLQLFNP